MNDTLKNVGSFALAFAVSYGITTLVKNAYNNAESIDENNTDFEYLNNNFSNANIKRVRNPWDR